MQSETLLNLSPVTYFFFFFNDTATTEIYTLSLHDALPISSRCRSTTTARGATTACLPPAAAGSPACGSGRPRSADRKSTRLNSSHSQISYAVFCLKKKKNDCIQRLCETFDSGYQRQLLARS